MDEQLVSFGSAVKDLGNGRVGGHLVLFGSPTAADLDREFFTKSTDFEIEDGAPAKIRYHHGKDPKLGRKILGRGMMKSDDVGVWIEGQLDLRDAYEQAVYALVKAGKLGWSSGSLPHLVEYEKADGGTKAIKSWPLGEDATLTPIPCDPRNGAVALKSLGDVPSIEELLAALDPTAAKGMFNQEMAECDAYGSIDQLTQMLSSTLWHLIHESQDGDVPDPSKELDRILVEFTAAMRDAINPALGPADTQKSARPHGGLTLESHVNAALAAAKTFGRLAPDALARLQFIIEDRTKSGRVISERNMTRIDEIHSAAQTILAHTTDMRAMAKKPDAMQPDWKEAKAVSDFVLESLERSAARRRAIAADV